VPARWRLPLATFLACQAIFLFWWAAFFPALMSYDSAAYVLQVTAGPWVNNYSVLYDVFVWLSLHVNGRPGRAGTRPDRRDVRVLRLHRDSRFRRIGIPGRWTAIVAVDRGRRFRQPERSSSSSGKTSPFVICLYLVVPTVAHLVSLREQPGWPPRPGG